MSQKMSAEDAFRESVEILRDAFEPALRQLETVSKALILQRTIDLERKLTSVESEIVLLKSENEQMKQGMRTLSESRKQANTRIAKIENKGKELSGGQVENLGEERQAFQESEAGAV